MAKPDSYNLYFIERDGTIVNLPESVHPRCAAFDAAVALLPWESR